MDCNASKRRRRERLITPSKHSATRGKNSHHKELRSSSTIITTFILFNSYGVGGNMLHPLSRLQRQRRVFQAIELKLN